MFKTQTFNQPLADNYPPKARTYSRTRCIRCESTRYHASREDCEKKAGATLRYHASEYVKKGFATDTEHAATLLIANGITQPWIASEFRGAYGQECPGLCCDALLVDGRVVIKRFLITSYAVLHLDWRDPRFPLTPENAGPLCSSCNQQKGQDPWPEFIARQRAILANLEQVIPNPQPPEQPTLF